MKICLIGMGIAVLLLIIYIVIALVSLIGKSIEHQNTEVGNHMLEDAAGNIETMMTSESDEKSESDKIMEKLEDFAARNDFSVEEYPVEMIENVTNILIKLINYI